MEEELNNSISVIYLLLALLLVSSCSSSSIKVSSNPKGAKVFLRNIGSNDRKEVGVTPILLDKNKIKKVLKDDGLFSIIVEHNLYHPKEIFVTETSSKQMSFDLTLIKLPKVDQAYEIDDIVEKFFKCQRYIRVKRYNDCEVVLEKLIEKYPEISTIYEFQGTMYYLKNEKKKAIQAFNTALKYNPENLESVRMLKLINMEFGK